MRFVNNLFLLNLCDKYDDGFKLFNKLLLFSTDDNIQQLRDNSLETKDSHKLLLQDLQLLQENARETQMQIAATSEFILQRTQVAAEQFENTEKQLQQINSTIISLTTMLKSVRAEFDGKLNWIVDTVGGGGELLLYLLYLYI